MIWQEKRLGDLADIQLGKMLDQKKNRGEYRPYLGNDNVQWNELKLDEIKLMRIQDSETERFRLRPGDLLVCEGGDPGRCALWTTDEEIYYQKALHRVRVGSELDPEYLLYYMMHLGTTQAIRQYYTGSSTIKHLPNAAIKRVVIRYPSLPDQKKIAGYLRSYDVLIENNRKQIKLLEEAARRLYKEWFIDLRFPGHEDAKSDPETGLPEGWKARSIEQLCLRVQSGSTPNRKNANYWNRNDYKWFKTAELEDHWLIQSEEHISQEALEETSVKEFPANSVLIAIYASPTLGRLGLLSESATFNQAALGFVADESLITKEWLFQKLLELRPKFNSIARGAGQQNISGEIVKKYEVVVPEADLILRYTNLTRPMLEEMLRIQKLNSFLAEARDRLLPKLMEGEVEL